MDWFTKNWRTSLIGISYVGCNVAAFFVPFMAEVCPWIDKLLIGGGFLAAADAGALAKLNQLAVESTAKAFRAKAYTGSLFAVALLGLTSPILAQTVTVDLDRASLAWDWAKVTPTDSDVESFVTRCGRTAGTFSSTTPISDPAVRSVPIRSIVNGSGRWFCVVAAVNRYGVSGNSNEVSFDAGAAPAVPANVRVQAQ